MLQDTRARQDGTRRSVVNEIECGQFYSRPMSGFALLELAAGFRWSKPVLTIAFAPRVLAADGSFCGYFTTDEGWGQAKVAPSAHRDAAAGCAMGTESVRDPKRSLGASGGAKLSFEVAYGTVSVKVLEFGTACSAATVSISGKSVAIASSEQKDGTLIVTLAVIAQVESGSVLSAVLSG